VKALAQGQTAATVIRPSAGWRLPDVAELWRNRELLYLLTWREIKIRYKQTVIGGAWAILQPLLMMLIFTVIFGEIMRASSGDVPYPLLVVSAILPWQLFSRGLTEAATSLVLNERLITKVYFPRLLVPASVVLAGLLDLGVASLLLMAMMVIYGVAPTVAAATLPLFVLLVVVAADVQYRDVRHTIPVLTMLWFFATPIFYSSSLVPEAWRVWYSLNPMVGVVEGFRWSLLGHDGLAPAMIAASTSSAIALLVSGLVYFRHTERSIADVI
jgi:lipopolysaccharide transport system permease protein